MAGGSWPWRLGICAPDIRSSPFQSRHVVQCLGCTISSCLCVWPVTSLKAPKQSPLPMCLLGSAQGKTLQPEEGPEYETEYICAATCPLYTLEPCYVLEAVRSPSSSCTPCWYQSAPRPPVTRLVLSCITLKALPAGRGVWQLSAMVIGCTPCSPLLGQSVSLIPVSLETPKSPVCCRSSSPLFPCGQL
jgi:hypothetical protein